MRSTSMRALGFLGLCLAAGCVIHTSSGSGTSGSSGDPTTGNTSPDGRIECGPGNSCPDGYGCMVASCASDTPCPSYCEEGRGPIADEGGATCGTRGASPCPEGQFCNHPIEASCGATDRPGQCEALPTQCPANLDPVCGCDNRTYPNACSASAAGVSVRASGECANPEPQAAGCVIGGCNSTLCFRAGEDLVSTCEADPSAGCYRGEACEVQPSGDCGWTMSDALQSCLAQFNE